MSSLLLSGGARRNRDLLMIAFDLVRCSAVPRDYAVQEGDILFQPLPHSGLVDAIEGVSLSIYSHCGIVVRKNDEWYSFDDERIYCSELIFKAVKTATGRQLGKVERLGDLNWEPHEAFIRSIEKFVPKDREMITPRALSEAQELTLVYSKDKAKRGRAK